MIDFLKIKKESSEGVIGGQRVEGADIAGEEGSASQGESSDQTPVHKVSVKSPKKAKSKKPKKEENPATSLKLYNRIEDNFHLSNKKALFLNMKNYYNAMHQNEFDALPVTFHIKSGVEDAEWERFKEYYTKEKQEMKEDEAKYDQEKKKRKEEKKRMEADSLKTEDNENEEEDKLKKKRSIWIVKPGENTNRGSGINVCKDLSEITALINRENSIKKRTYILQRYIDRPLLIFKRKFDIRCYAMMTSINGHLKGYYYQEGYLRTSSKEFSIANLNNKLIHLTNDAIQKKSDDYGKFETGNKLSYKDFQKYLDTHMAELKININRDVLPQIRVFSKFNPSETYHRYNAVSVWEG